MHESQVSCAIVSYVKLIDRNEFNTHSGVCKIDNHTKYSLIRRGDKDGFMDTIERHGKSKTTNNNPKKPKIRPRDQLCGLLFVVLDFNPCFFATYPK